jgi:alkylation response protein AidB-like acyl-CoA dehydrogenase
MADYRAPVEDIVHALRLQADLASIQRCDRYSDVTTDLVAAILDEGAKFAERVLTPLDVVGDAHGCQLENGVVRTAPGFSAAYKSFAEQGWQGVPADPALDGQGLPLSVSAALQEMWYAANMSLSLCPLLTQGAIELLEAHASPEQRELYLRHLISGRWTGTMNLTEPGAGSDVGALTTRARPDGSGWRITGQKIFITYGEHDMAENIVHLVLARTPDAPPGSKGISLFIVPKFIANADGTLGPRNDVRCLSLEKKLGIHASPTCVMSYGDDGGAWGELVGQVNQGMALMFTMMNNARLAVAIQGLAAGERAWQAAIDHAHLRKQGRLPGTPPDQSVPIVEHPDVARMLMTMRALVDGMRALIFFTAGAADRARSGTEADARKRAQARTDLLTPIAKAWCTDRGCEVADLGIQVHGGLGFIEQTGAAKIYRDARITPIYEGTNGIQAIDLIGRKLCRDRGENVRALCTEIEQTLSALSIPDQAGDAACIDAIAACRRLAECSTSLVETSSRDPQRGLAAATPYLRLIGDTIVTWRLLIAAYAEDPQSDGSTARKETAIFFARRILPETLMLEAQIRHSIVDPLPQAGLSKDQRNA